jgi:general secretion pathway protein C
MANVLLVGLVIYFAWVLARVSWGIAWQEPPLPASQALSRPATPGSGLSDRPLAAYNLFGQPPAGAPVAESVRRTAPETRLRMRLEGVLVAARPENSGAIVAGTDGSTDYYRVGDVIPRDVKLVEVEPQRIFIRRNGEVESLTFDEEDAGGMVSQVEQAERESGLDLSSPENFVSDAQRKLAADGDAALARFGLRPVDSGSAQGYRYDGSNAMLSALNLQTGDVITAINGYTLGNIEEDRELLSTLQNESRLQVEVVRDGTRFTVNYAVPR